MRVFILIMSVLTSALAYPQRSPVHNSLPDTLSVEPQHRTFGQQREHYPIQKQPQEEQGKSLSLTVEQKEEQTKSELATISAELPAERHVRKFGQRGEQREALPALQERHEEQGDEQSNISSISDELPTEPQPRVFSQQQEHHEALPTQQHHDEEQGDQQKKLSFRYKKNKPELTTSFSDTLHHPRALGQQREQGEEALPVQQQQEEQGDHQKLSSSIGAELPEGPLPRKFGEEREKDEETLPKHQEQHQQHEEQDEQQNKPSSRTEESRPTVAILHSANNGDGSNGFEYSFESENGIRQEATGELRTVNESPVIVMRGRYEYVGDDGQTYNVDWYADETGYHVGAPSVENKSVEEDNPVEQGTGNEGANRNKRNIRSPLRSSRLRRAYRPIRT